MLEIERKFLVREMDLPPNLGDWPVTHILQGYLAITDDGKEIRIRQTGEAYTLTVKSGLGLKRSELEIILTEDQFKTLWIASTNNFINKKRYIITLGEHNIELDIYENSLAGLITAEVEFNSVEESLEFVPPPWFLRDITEDERYKNRNLALFGMPA